MGDLTIKEMTDFDGVLVVMRITLDGYLKAKTAGGPDRVKMWLAQEATEALFPALEALRQMDAQQRALRQ